MERDKRMTDTEKAALERRIDELCEQVERLKSEFKKMDVWHSQELKAAMDENAKVREFTARLANALGIDSEWCDPEWCDSDCMDEFKCHPTGDYGEIHCPAFARMTELGIEVPDGEF